ncbi:hypothetical protein HY745_02585 [Candidatus Desantisbacteria bacterium]|nr:hypothetical protein [Candidatus Desantisbacteria bacterium]
MIIQQSILKLKTEPSLSAHGNSLRGYISNQFPQYDILHNHKDVGKFIYLYPRIQYRIIKEEGYIIGIEEGSNLVQLIGSKIETITLKDEIHKILKKQITSEDVQFGITDSVITYSFIKPWLALNEKNYSDFIHVRTKKDKDVILKNILTGNLLSISKSLGYIVEQQINVTSLNLSETDSFLKGTPMLGFLGTFSVNFEIPDFWGIGKSVSRGFGTVKKLKI